MTGELDGDAARRRRRGRWRRPAVALAVLVGSLVLVEAVVRARQWLRYGTTEPTFYEFAEDPLSGLEIPAPGSSAGPIRIDERGFRGEGVAMPKPAGTVRLAFLGGSTTFCAEASSLETTWPVRVVRELSRRHPGVAFDLVNAAAGGYSTRESLVNLERRVAPLEPDVLFVYHATNDVTQDTRALAVDQGIFEPRERETLAIGDWWLTWFLVEKNLRARLARSADRPLLSYDTGELSARFGARLDALLTACEREAAVTVVGTFCHRARPGQSPEELEAACSSSLHYMPYMTPRGLLEVFRAYDETIREVAGRHDVVLVELEDAIPADGEHFNDSVHLLDPGLAILARRMVEALDAAPAFRALLERVRG